MFKIIKLLYMLIFIISCGGETGTVYYNNKPTNNINNNTNNNIPANKGNTTIQNSPKVEEITCLPGSICDKKEPSIKIKPTKPCLPGVQC